MSIINVLFHFILVGELFVIYMIGSFMYSLNNQVERWCNFNTSYVDKMVDYIEKNNNNEIKFKE